MSGPDPHPDDERLEQYALGRLDEIQSAPVEEHLLICPACQDRLFQTDEYLASMRSVAPRLRSEDEARQRRSWLVLFRWPALNPAWAAALLLVLALVLARPWRWAPRVPAVPAVVMLQVSRGNAAAPLPEAPAGRPLVLVAGTSQLAEAPRYRIEVVNAAGRRIHSATAQPENGQLRAVLDGALAEGLYFVRLYSPSGPLLREFGLRVR